jgi:hypothetical protein
MPPVKLYSQKYNTGGMTGQLRPVLFSDAGAASIRAPRINVNAANVQYTPMPVPGIQKTPMDAAFEGAAALSQQYVQSAFQYQQRQDKAIADAAVIKAEDSLRRSFLGELQPDGTFKGGYANTKGLDASTNYTAYQTSVDQGLNEILEELSPSQRQFAVNRIAQMRDTMLTKAATHASTQLSQAELELKNTAFTQMMEKISTGDYADLEGMQNVLSAWANDPDELKKRNSQLTKQALYTALRQGGTTEATILAETMLNTPGIGDAEEVDSFIKAMESDQRSANAEARAAESHRITQEKQAREETKRNVDIMFAHEFASSVLSGGLGEFLRDAVNNSGDRLTALAHAQSKIGAGLTELWENAEALGGVGQTGLLKKQIKDQLEKVPPQFRDDVVQTLDALEAKQEQDAIDAQKRENEAFAQEQKALTNAVTMQANKALVDYGAGKLNKDQLAAKYEELLGNPYFDDAVAQDVLNVLNGEGSAYEGEKLTFINENWQRLYDNPKALEEAMMGIGIQARTEFLKRAENDRKSGAPRYRKAALDELKRFYKVQEVNGVMAAIPGFGYADHNLTADEALANYSRAQGQFQVVMDEYVKQGMPVAQAANKALGDIINDPALREGMPEFGRSVSEAGKSAKVAEKRTYQDDHSPVVKRFTIPQGFVPGLKGDPNILSFARKVTSDWVDQKKKGVDTQGEDPQLVVARRVVQTFAGLQQKLREAGERGNPADLAIIQRMVTNHIAQTQYLMDLVPLSAEQYQTYVQVVPGGDGDTANLRGRNNTLRYRDVGAAETSTEKGRLQADQVQRMMEAMSPEGYWRMMLDPGSGFYKRMVGNLGLGDEAPNLDTIIKKVLGVSDYQQGQVEKREGR